MFFFSSLLRQLILCTKYIFFSTSSFLRGTSTSSSSPVLASSQPRVRSDPIITHSLTFYRLLSAALNIVLLRRLLVGEIKLLTCRTRTDGLGKNVALIHLSRVSSWLTVVPTMSTPTINKSTTTAVTLPPRSFLFGKHIGTSSTRYYWWYKCTHHVIRCRHDGQIA